SAGVSHGPCRQVVIRYRIDRALASDTVPYRNRALSLSPFVARRRQEEGDTIMNRQRQIDLLKRLLHCVDTKTTALADAPWHNEVYVYADPQHLARETHILFLPHTIF